MIEEELRAAFARHEDDAPLADAVAQAINEGYRRKQRGRHLSVLAAVVVAALVAVPSVAVGLSHRGGGPAVGDSQAGTPTASAPAYDGLSMLVFITDGHQPSDRVTPDVMLAMSIVPTANHIAFASLPVDARIPGGLTVGDAYRSGGLSEVEQAFRSVDTKHPKKDGSTVWARVDGGAVITYTGLAQMVQASGGVDLHVDKRTVSVDVGHTKDGKFAVPYHQTAQGLVPVPGVTPEVYEVGDHHFAGWQAADYVRQHQLINGVHGEQDLRNAQSGHLGDLFRAMKMKATNPVLMNSLLKIASQDVIFDPGSVPVDKWRSVLLGLSTPGSTRPSPSPSGR